MISWDEAEKPFKFGAAVIAAAGGIAASYTALQRWYKKRLRIKRILRSDDKDLEAVWRIHQLEFADSVADEFGDLQRWLEEAAVTRKSRNRRFDEFLLCIKADGEVLGYVFAQYYISSRYLFVSYVAVNDSVLLARKNESEVVTKLFKGLLKCLTKNKYDWLGIIAEFETIKVGSICSHAQVLMVAFQRTLRKLRGIFDPNADIYKICLDYKQPILRPDELEGSVLDQSYDQWLIMIPRNADSIVKVVDDRKLFIEKETASSIIRFVLLDVYQDAFEDCASYGSYLEAECERYVSHLPANVEVQTRWRTHKQSKFDKARQAALLGNSDGVDAFTKPMSLG